jgi:hypothetical protein
MLVISWVAKNYKLLYDSVIQSEFRDTPHTQYFVLNSSGCVANTAVKWVQNKHWNVNLQNSEHYDILDVLHTLLFTNYKVNKYFNNSQHNFNDN